MSVSRVEWVRSQLYQAIERSNDSEPLGLESFSGEFVKNAWSLAQAQLTSRFLDFEARRLKDEGKAFYTIGSSGHEGNAVLGSLLAFDDFKFLHYRSGALVCAQLEKSNSPGWLEHLLDSFCANESDPVSGGRHKVWGSKELRMPPQTSTIASQLPKAVGTAMAIARAKKLHLSLPIQENSIVMVSFGDASLNHASCQAALNTAAWVSYQHLPLPILFVCEDNGIGISVRTPSGWVESSMAGRPFIHYLQADGLKLDQAYERASEAIAFCRKYRRPTFLHLKTVRLLGHAGSDVETEYLSKEDIVRNESKDPLLYTLKLIIETGLQTATSLKSWMMGREQEIRELGQRCAQKPKLKTAQAVMAPLALLKTNETIAEAHRKIEDIEIKAELSKSRHMAPLINQALSETLQRYPETILFGEDVAKKGGVYHVTTGLSEKFGVGRVFNTLLDETTILGVAIGASHLGFLPIPEIQYLAYYHNAEDQIRGEAGSMQFFSNSQFANPMVIRVASFAYQKGFGGHFHNDHAIGALREIPGVVIITPSRGDDAVKLFRTAVSLAKIEGKVVFFLEPIALYMTKDLHVPGDGLWLSVYPEPGAAIDLGEVGLVKAAHPAQVLIVTYANGNYMSLRVAHRLKAEGIAVDVLDLRFLAPLPYEKVREHAKRVGKVLVVDECRESGGVADALVADLAIHCKNVTVSKLCAKDTYIPLGPAADLVLVSELQIEACVKALIC